MNASATTETQVQASGSKGASGNVELEFDTSQMLQELTERLEAEKED